LSTRSDPRTGPFRYGHTVEVRFRDTDALGHVNNAVYLTYFEAARAGYYRALTGATFGIGINLAGPSRGRSGASGGEAASGEAPASGEAANASESDDDRTFIVARAEVDYRAPAYFGEILTVECRIGWASRSSFSLEYRITAPESERGTARLIADGATVQVMYDYRRGRATRLPDALLSKFAAYEGHAIPRRLGPNDPARP